MATAGLYDTIEEYIDWLFINNKYKTTNKIIRTNKYYVKRLKEREFSKQLKGI
jgi:hypothetical protein